MICYKNFSLQKLQIIVLGLIMIFSCLSICTPQVSAAENDIVLTVTGDGVEKTVEFTLAELEALPQAKYTYSGYNHWPSLQVFEDMQGPTLKTILDAVGLKDDATLLRVKMNDVVYFEFTKAQLLDEPRFYFPDGEKDEDNLGEWPPSRSQKGKTAVETMIALNQDHGKLLYGQCAVNEPTCCKNRMLSGLCRGGTIEVLTTPLEQWDAPQADVMPGAVAGGTEVKIQHHDGTPYHAVVYYTLDGSEPGYGSTIANISYPNFQPDLNKAIPIDKSLTIKTKTIGMSKLDSEVVTYEYTVGKSDSSTSGLEDTEQNVGLNDQTTSVTGIDQFVDIKDHPAKDDIYALVSSGIINGVTATEFKPEDNLTRAQIAKLLTTALKITPDQGTALSFTDVPVGSWYYDYVAAAVQAGLVTGYSDSIFAPDENVNHEQLAVMIARALRMRASMEISESSAEEILEGFSDKGEISPWARQDIALLVNCGIVDAASGSSFAPKTPTTRAEASVRIFRMCRQLNLL